MPRERPTQLAIAALVVIIGSVAWTWLGPGGSTPTGTAPVARAARRGGSGTGNEDVLPGAAAVRLEALAARHQEPESETRNPFRFGRQAAAPREASVAPTPAFTVTPGQPPAPSGPAPPPPITMKFIGMVELADGAMLAVLAPGDGLQPLHGQVGDIIDGRYRILKIGTESVELAYLDGRGRQTIRLTGQ